MMMREVKPNPSQKPFTKRPWFWPVIYTSMALVIVAIVFGFNELYKNQQEESAVEQSPVAQDQNLISTSAKLESLKYPFKEEYFNEVTVLTNFYDVNADEAKRENALLVFNNQVFTTSTGMTIAINSEPFAVVAAMSGTVKEVKMDVFTGNRITIEHPNGMETRYNSVSDILIKEGDQVSQGEQIATAQENESNPNAGVHLHFELLEQGKFVDPEKYLSF